MNTLIESAVIPCAAAAGRNVAALPPRGVSFHWTPDQQIVGYRERAKIEPVRVVGCGAHVCIPPLTVHQISPRWTWNGQAMDVDRYMEATRVSGLIALKDGEVLIERYGLGRTERDRWDVQSVSKSVTAILVGAAIQDGYIKSMDSMVTEYIPELKGSAYEGVTIRHLVTMTSGIKWDNDYRNPNGNGTQQRSEPFVNSVNPTVAYMRRLPRDNQPGTKYVYSDGDTDLAGILVSNAAGKSMSEYLSQKLWQPYGMEKDAYWIVDPAGYERGGTGISMTLRDLARTGQFVLEGGKAGGVQVLPPDWLVEATSAQVTFSTASLGGEKGYGYCWWIYEDAYAALGHAGQAIFVYPKDKVVIAINSAWLETNQYQPNRPEYCQMLDFAKALHAGAVAHF
ncbi:serine hydrolase [Mesorhizobium sp. VK9D]|uniref:serine hydrolase domain-containing protein n=1 Tax=Mesorhizobium australafricanum TaxID=3072311 RepID=UPI002A24789B|nr:serine hydrolase [Mesorhizobium sp. VK9D]MDX8457105.1 serine hydrolase [Mesorhizobium sp. VK9D]